MSAHHDNHQHSTEPKKVAFSTPLILGLVTLLVILLSLSTCDKKHKCCEDETKCEKTETKHGEEHNNDAHASDSAHKEVAH